MDSPLKVEEVASQDLRGSVPGRSIAIPGALRTAFYPALKGELSSTHLGSAPYLSLRRSIRCDLPTFETEKRLLEILPSVCYSSVTLDRPRSWEILAIFILLCTAAALLGEEVSEALVGIFLEPSGRLHHRLWRPLAQAIPLCSWSADVSKGCTRQGRVRGRSRRSPFGRYRKAREADSSVIRRLPRILPQCPTSGRAKSL
jgi:hypothetical protein